MRSPGHLRMNFPPAMSIRHVQGKSTSPPVPRTGGGWRVGNLLLAPHRLGFFLAVVVLMYAAAWWALVQVDRVSAGLTLPYAMSPSLGHAAVMTFGFIPLFFSGFLFTAGPKWLGVEPLCHCCCWHQAGCCGSPPSTSMR